MRSGFRRYGLYGLLNGMKEEGVPMGTVIENLCIACLHGNCSMKDLDEYVSRNPLRKEYYCGTMDIRRWTYQRDLGALGTYLEEVVDHLTRVSRAMFPDEPTHAYVDGSHIERHGPKGRGVMYGEGGGSVQLQNQFMTASNVSTGIPITIEAYPGNENDPQQYGDFIPQLLFLLKRGSLVIMDNGGSSASVLDDILSHGDHYLTRVRINSSDEASMSEDVEDMVYVGMGTACIMHTFQSSGRTTYLYFSIDSYGASISRAQKAVAAKDEDRKRAQKVLERGDAMKVIKLPKSDYYTVEIDGAKLVMTNDPWMAIDPDKELKDSMPAKAGWFKLECSFPMDPRLALVVYRHRVDIEHLISSLKSVINLDPLRVWAGDSIRGRLVIGLICQFMLSAAIYEMEPSKKRRTVDGKEVEVTVKPSPATVIKELSRYKGVVKRMEWGGYSIEGHYDDGVIDAFLEVIDRHESEDPIEVPEDLDWQTLPIAQWVAKKKNCKDLAMSIAQYLEKTIFPEYMDGRSHWKTSDIPFVGNERAPLGIDPESDGAEGLVGRRSYYGSRRARSSGSAQLRNSPLRWAQKFRRARSP